LIAAPCACYAELRKRKTKITGAERVDGSALRLLRRSQKIII